MYKVEHKSKNELPTDLKQPGMLPENGSGSEYASYLVVKHDDKILFVASDAMEPEDARFFRDMQWIKTELERAYQLGVKDAQTCPDPV